MTIYALSTGPGVAGIAIIRISGPETSEVVKRLTNALNTVDLSRIRYTIELNSVFHNEHYRVSNIMCQNWTIYTGYPVPGLQWHHGVLLPVLFAPHISGLPVAWTHSTDRGSKREREKERD